MAKTLVDNSHGGRWTGTTVKLTPTDKTGTPEDFEELYERRHRPQKSLQEPRPKLKEISNPSMADRLAEHNLDG